MKKKEITYILFKTPVKLLLPLLWAEHTPQRVPPDYSIFDSSTLCLCLPFVCCVQCVNLRGYEAKIIKISKNIICITHWNLLPLYWNTQNDWPTFAIRSFHLPHLSLTFTCLLCGFLFAPTFLFLLLSADYRASLRRPVLPLRQEWFDLERRQHCFASGIRMCACASTFVYVAKFCFVKQNE